MKAKNYKLEKKYILMAKSCICPQTDPETQIPLT